MSLDDFRNEVEEEEVIESEEAEEDTLDEDAEADESQESEESEESEDTDDDFDLEIDEEPKKVKRKPEEAMLYKLTKKQKQLSSAKTEIEQLREEIESLKAGKTAAPAPVARPKAPEVIPFPDLYDPGINGDRTKYSQAVYEYTQRLNEQGQRTAQEQEEARRQAKIEHERALRLATRTASFTKAHKLNEDKAADYVRSGVEALDKVTGVKGGGLYLLDSVGDDSEKLAYYFGKNPSELSRVREWLEEDDTGLKAIAQMTRLVTTKLKPKTSKSKKSLEPDEPLKGSTSTKNASDLQRRYDATEDFNELMKIRREAAERGVKLT